MGRALWLSGRHDEAVGELRQSVDLSPNFALGHYTLAFVQSQSGDPLAAIKAADHSRLLSPFDPLLFGMLGSRAMAHVRLRQFDEAVAWSAKAAMQPNAHVLILAIAAFCHALAGQIGQCVLTRAQSAQCGPCSPSMSIWTLFSFLPMRPCSFAWPPKQSVSIETRGLLARSHPGNWSQQQLSSGLLARGKRLYRLRR